MDEVAIQATRFIHSEVPQTLLQCEFVQCRFDYAHENKCEELFSKHRKLSYMPYSKHIVVSYEKYVYCLKS
jgi:hypothetical protein